MDLIEKLKEGNLERSDSSRAIAETLGQMSLARRFPRDMANVETKLMQICSRRNFAEGAFYLIPRGNQKIEGLTIRVAEAVVNAMGNVSYGVTTEPDKEEDATVYTVYAIDMENNVRVERRFVRKHTRKVKGVYKKVVDPQEQYELIAADASRRLRTCIFNIAPGYLLDMAHEQCKRTLSTKTDQNIVDKIVVAFQSHNVSRLELETKIGKKLDKATSEDINVLRGTLNALKHKMAKKEELFKKES